MTLLRCEPLFVIASLSLELVPERWWSGMVNIVLIGEGATRQSRDIIGDAVDSRL
jgi:hypothetical protein